MSCPKSLRNVSLFVWSLLLFGLLAAVLAQKDAQQNRGSRASFYTDSDAYAIYAVLLQSDKHPFYVVQTEIDAYPGMTAKDLGIEGGHAFMQVWGSVMDNYARQNQNPKLLVRSIPVDVAYELVPKSDMFKSQHGQPGWDDFYQRYSSSGGFYWFSAVGFNRQRTRAIVSMGHACGMLCGSGQPHFFEKQGTKWREVNVDPTIGVWAS